MLTWLRNVWAWVVAALGAALLAVVLLWRRAARQRDEAREQRDAARDSAERERQHADDSAAVRDAFRGRRVDVEAERVEAVEQIEARPQPITPDELVDELNRRMEARRNGR